LQATAVGHPQQRVEDRPIAALDFPDEAGRLAALVAHDSAHRLDGLTSLAVDPAVHVTVIETTVAPASNGRQMPFPRCPVNPCLWDSQPLRNFLGGAQRFAHADKTRSDTASARLRLPLLIG
jgi:hypothetical protein